MLPVYRRGLRLLGRSAGLVARLIPVVVVATGAAGSLQIRSPESPRQAGEMPPLAVPLAVPEQGISYLRLAHGAAPARSDRLGIGQLRGVPADMLEVEAFLPDLGQPDPARISFAVLANVRYKGQGGQVQLTTIQPSAAAAGQTLLLGNTTVTLPDGSAAYLAGNRLAFAREGLIIAASGTVPADRLLDLAASVVIR